MPLAAEQAEMLSGSASTAEARRARSRKRDEVDREDADAQFFKNPKRSPEKEDTDLLQARWVRSTGQIPGNHLPELPKKGLCLVSRYLKKVCVLFRVIMSCLLIRRGFPSSWKPSAKLTFNRTILS